MRTRLFCLVPPTALHAGPPGPALRGVLSVSHFDALLASVTLPCLPVLPASRGQAAVRLRLTDTTFQRTVYPSCQRAAFRTRVPGLRHGTAGTQEASGAAKEPMTTCNRRWSAHRATGAYCSPAHPTFPPSSPVAGVHLGTCWRRCGRASSVQCSGCPALIGRISESIGVCILARVLPYFHAIMAATRIQSGSCFSRIGSHSCDQPGSFCER